MPDIARDMIDGVALPFDQGEDGSLTFVHLNPWPNRMIIGAAGLIPLMAPYELLWRQSAPFSLAMLPFWLLSIMALSIALPLILGAILGISGQTVIDPAGRELRTHAIGMGSLRWTRVYPLATIATIDVRENDFFEAGPSYDLYATFRNRKRPLRLWSFTSEDRALHVAAIVKERIDPASTIAQWPRS